MTNRIYLLFTILLLILTFSPSGAANMGASAREPIGVTSWSVTIPAMAAPSIPQRMMLAEANDALPGVSTTRGKISDNQSPRPQDRLTFPKQDANQRTNSGQTGGQGIFDTRGRANRQLVSGLMSTPIGNLRRIHSRYNSL